MNCAKKDLFIGESRKEARISLGTLGRSSWHENKYFRKEISDIFGKFGEISAEFLFHIYIFFLPQQRIPEGTLVYCLSMLSGLEIQYLQEYLGPEAQTSQASRASRVTAFSESEYQLVELRLGVIPPPSKHPYFINSSSPTGYLPNLSAAATARER